jgi:hypothetical protein
MRSLSRCRSGLVAVLVAGFFVNVDLRLRPDGSGKMLVVYPANPLTSRDTEDGRFASRVSKLTAFTLRGRTAYSRVRFSDLNALSEAAELKNTALGYQADGNGGGLFWATLRGSLIFTTDSPNDATIVVRFPGPVTEANATTVTNATARWQAPIARYFSWDGIPMVARFTATPKQVASAPRP